MYENASSLHLRECRAVGGGGGDSQQAVAGERAGGQARLTRRPHAAGRGAERVALSAQALRLGAATRRLLLGWAGRAHFQRRLVAGRAPFTGFTSSRATRFYQRVLRNDSRTDRISGLD